MDKNKPAICCIGYSRPDSIRRLLASVGRAYYSEEDITLIISIDESSKSDEIENIAKSFEWKYGKKIIKRYNQRLGLKKHSLLCGDLSIEYGAVIFLEDDVVVAPGFYEYTINTLKKYSENEKILGISLYSQKWVTTMMGNFIPSNNGYDVYFAQMDLSHGQCWIGERWSVFREWYKEHEYNLPNYDKRVHPSVYNWNRETSWSKYISFFMVEKDLYYVCPYYSYATNLSELGIHASKTTDICQVPLAEGIKERYQYPDFEKAIKYDGFFERMDSFVNKIADIPIDQICFDLNGMKYDWTGYRYILTSKNLPYKIIDKYGCNMEPIEANIIYQCRGDALRLYEIPRSYEGPNSVENFKFHKNKKIIEHDLNRFSYIALLSYLLDRLINKIINAFHN